MGRVVHYEITADDTARARKFYEIFGWDIKDSGMPGGEYWLTASGPPDETGIGGAIMPRSYQKQPSIIWISVDDIDDMIEKVKANGGEAIGDKQKIPGVGTTIYIKDTEGNIVGMLQPEPPAK
jgi:uncharacterized protein